MKKSLRWLPRLRFVLLAMMPGPALAQSDLPADPVAVEVGVMILDVFGIDGAQQTMSVDVAVRLRWTDPRLAGRGDEIHSLDEIWHPVAIVFNNRSLRVKNEDLVVDPEGRVDYVRRQIGDLSIAADLADFPFDRHEFAVQILLARLPSESIALTVDEEFSGRSEELTIPDWKIGSVQAVPEVVRRPGSGGSLRQIDFRFPAERATGYYVWKLLFPFVLVVFMSWSVFWIDLGQLGPRLGLSTTSILTLIAYQFVLAGLVPRLSYLTRMDRFTVSSTALVFLALGEVILTSALVARERRELAVRWNRLARFVFPLVFLGILVTAFAA
jgi:hypothetical protein